MAEEKDLDSSATENPEGEAGKPKSKKILIIVIVGVLVLVLAGAGVFLSGILKGEKKVEENAEALVEKIVYFDMDEFLVNLNNPGNQVSFLKTIITLEVPNQATMNEIQSKMPRIRDAFQTYLRELRSTDLQGSAGIQRLRVELLLRVNSILESGKVNSVLFKEIIVQ
ncbi:MAG: flagellar basal body-associated FliL family protein [Rickettsiales bacterium]|nr:flagellar basal body-associated FliL family protein [Rickettsiales bacterium]